MDPQYFKKELTWSEAVDYMEGMQRRHWNDWQRTRLEVNVAARCAGNKRDVLGEFDFEKRRKPRKEYTEEEIEETRNWAKKMEAALVAKKKS